MRTQKVFVRSLVSLILVSLMLLPGLGNAYPSGIGGEEVWAGGDIDDVAKEGCLCHAAEPSNSVMIVLDDVPYTWAAGATYDMRLEIIGGPESSNGGFSARVSAGEFSGDGQDWNGDTMTRTHQNANSRIYTISWTAPETDSGIVNFWITGNAVNGNGAPECGPGNEKVCEKYVGPNSCCTHAILTEDNGKQTSVFRCLNQKIVDTNFQVKLGGV